MTAFEVYPCNRGSGLPKGYHHFQAGESRIVACIYCGKRGPDEAQPHDLPPDMR